MSPYRTDTMTLEEERNSLRDLLQTREQEATQLQRLLASAESRLAAFRDPKAVVLCPSESEPTSYFTSLSDSDLPERLRPVAEKWRKLATSLDYSGPVAWRVGAGFTLKAHAPKFGPCYDNFSYLRDWNFTDEPTSEGIVFWIPRLLPGSTGKNVNEQKALMTKIRQDYGLPGSHLASFGNVATLAGLILAHFKATGERVPLDRLWIRTDVCRADGDRLFLGAFGESGLGCDGWRWDGRRSVNLGVFALGVEVLGS